MISISNGIQWIWIRHVILMRCTQLFQNVPEVFLAKGLRVSLFSSVASAPWPARACTHKEKQQKPRKVVTSRNPELPPRANHQCQRLSNEEPKHHNLEINRHNQVEQMLHDASQHWAFKAWWIHPVSSVFVCPDCLLVTIFVVIWCQNRSKKVGRTGWSPNSEKLTGLWASSKGSSGSLSVGSGTFAPRSAHICWHVWILPWCHKEETL